MNKKRERKLHNNKKSKANKFQRKTKKSENFYLNL